MMLRVAAVLTAVALVGTFGSMAGAALTPGAYRTTMNGFCVQAKHQLGTTPSTGSATPQQLIAALQRVLGIFDPLLAKVVAIAPPTSLNSGHQRVVTALRELVGVGQALIPKLKKGVSLANALKPLNGQLKAGSTGLKTGFKQLGLTTCSKLLGGG
jgi:hypothetical protein